MRIFLRTLLNRLRFVVLESADGRDAMEQLAANGPFDLAVIDWNIPIMTGFELVVLLRADRRFDRMPILMVTTEGSPVERARALSAGVNEYLVKPITENELIEKVRTLCGAAAT
jgi:two-component system chemotaxis response regulator CheY